MLRTLLGVVLIHPDSEPAGDYIFKASSVSMNLSALGVSSDHGSNSAADVSSSAGVFCVWIRAPHY